jgi:hypothetical protein
MNAQRHGGRIDQVGALRRRQTSLENGLLGPGRRAAQLKFLTEPRVRRGPVTDSSFAYAPGNAHTCAGTVGADTGSAAARDRGRRSTRWRSIGSRPCDMERRPRIGMNADLASADEIVQRGMAIAAKLVDVGQGCPAAMRPVPNRPEAKESSP